MTVNRERLIELAAWAAGEQAKKDLGLPSEWEQIWWFTRRRGVNACGTACCIAGKVAFDDGLQLASADTWDEVGDGTLAAQVVLPDGSMKYVEYYAQEVLGLTSTQAGALFVSTNKLPDILRIVGELLEEPDTEPRPRRVRVQWHTTEVIDWEAVFELPEDGVTDIDDLWDGNCSLLVDHEDRVPLSERPLDSFEREIDEVVELPTEEGVA